MEVAQSCQFTASRWARAGSACWPSPRVVPPPLPLLWWLGKTPVLSGRLRSTEPTPNSRSKTSLFGASGVGTLRLTGGGTGTVRNPVIVGQNQGGSGIVIISGTDSKLSTPYGITVGQAGTGQVSISQGGQLGAYDLYVAKDAGSQGVVTVDGSGSLVGGNITVGQNGTGAFVATGGASISSGHLRLGYNSDQVSPPSGTGTMAVSGPGTHLTTLFDAQIGYQTFGALLVANGATWNSSQDTFIGDGSGGLGTVTIDGNNSQWISQGQVEVGHHGSTGSLTIGNGAVLSLTSGVVENYSGGTVDVQLYGALNSDVYNDGSLTNDGLINGYVSLSDGVLSGSGIITGQLGQTGGILSPGDSPGTLTVAALNFHNGAYRFEINSAGGIAGLPRGWNLLMSQGQAFVSGAMTIDLVSLTQTDEPGNVFDFNPEHDYHWTFLTAGSGITYFDPVHFTVDTSAFSNPFGGTFYVSQVGNSLQLNYSVPEPSSAVLALLAVGLLAMYKRDNQ